MIEKKKVNEKPKARNHLTDLKRFLKEEGLHTCIMKNNTRGPNCMNYCHTINVCRRTIVFRRGISKIVAISGKLQKVIARVCLQ